MVETSDALLVRPWNSSGLLFSSRLRNTSIKKKQKLRRPHVLSLNPIEQDIYKQYSNVLTRVKTASEKLYFHKAIHGSKNSPETTWEVLRQLLSSNKKSLDLPSVMNIDKKRVEEPELITESFSNCFGNIGRRLAENIKYFLHNSSKVASSFALIPPTANEVFNELNCLKNKKAAGSDDLSPFFIKTAWLIIAPYLTYFMEFMFNQGIFPNILKIAKVIPIFKSGKKSLIENCRPISLCTCLF